ncbi:Cyclolysin secretion/processing ATP-binding protein CyaB [Seminavis robusta]|uniref:Cyclolysin secretion/processing ATP-binding protein CyaB n=1 Tax=Seminavis robusta TaxID=568900 RepID=A0A9N8ESZ1_9STRA|nr:Cyclolysin secretion/processing ATP-binding protein CyaB [Seminavis robusta]|eukprot:Sro1789_g297650.1 Cyclolysin secretion/processing ATP-binding protein CyaB (981) ;mRNA; f:4471-8399
MVEKGNSLMLPGTIGAILVVVAGLSHQQSGFVVGLLKGFFSEDCWETWPPSAECVVHNVPILIAVISTVVLFQIVSVLTAKPTQAQEDMYKEQFEKRHEVIEEYVSTLKEHEELKSDELGTVDAKELLSKIRELAELSDYKEAVMLDAIDWLWKLFEKELRIAIDKTREQTVVEYADGEKLAALMERIYGNLKKFSSSAGYQQDPEDKKRINRQIRVAWKLGIQIGFEGISKACKMIAIAGTDSLIWVAAQTVFTTLTASTTALSYSYRAQVLQSLIEGGDQFWMAAKASVLIELLSTVMELVTDVLIERGQRVLGRKLQVKYFEAFTKRDLEWWRAMERDGKEAWTFIWLLYEASDNVEKFLSTPQDMVSNITTIVTHVYVIYRASSSSVYTLLAAQFAVIAFNFMSSFGFRWLHKFAVRGVLEGDEWTWMDRLDPSYVRMFKSFARCEKEVKVYTESLACEAQKSQREFMVESLRKPIDAIAKQAGEVVQLDTTSKLAKKGKVGIAEAHNLLTSAEEVGDTTQTSWRLLRSVIKQASPVAKVYDMCTLKSKIDPDCGLVPPNRAKGHIKFEEVQFSYPRGAEVLKGASMAVGPGQTLGITGSAGCGKSTAMRLLERFYDVTGGRILLDGIDIREYNPTWLRSQMAVVAQEPQLLPITLRQNLTFGCKVEPSLKEIEDACRAANILDAIKDKNKFPRGLNTRMSSQGNISGGEKQRIAIARAILVDPPILLLDEATSALDEENQEKVQAALNILMEGRTTLVIAHRLSTIKNSECIVAFDKGKVVESGTHEELLKTEGSIYAKLWNKQAAGPGATEEDDDEEEDEAELEAEEKEDPEICLHPTLSAETRLHILENHILESNMPAATKKETLRIIHQLENEAMKVEDAHEINLTSKVAADWQGLVDRHEEDETNAKMKKAVRKIMFKNLHHKISANLDDSDIIETRETRGPAVRRTSLVGGRRSSVARRSSITKRTSVVG